MKNQSPQISEHWLHHAHDPFHSLGAKRHGDALHIRVYSPQTKQVKLVQNNQLFKRIGKTDYFEWQGNVVINIPPENYQGNAPDIGGFESPYTVGLNDDIVYSSKISLYQNYPNPFNPSTTIEFSIKNDSNVELSIYNIKGQRIKVLANHEFSKGNHVLVWDGVDSFNNVSTSVSSLKICIGWYGTSLFGKKQHRYFLIILQIIIIFTYIF